MQKQLCIKINLKHLTKNTHRNNTKIKKFSKLQIKKIKKLLQLIKNVWSYEKNRIIINN